MSSENMKAFAKKLYFEDDFYLLACRNPDKAIKVFPSDAFDPAEIETIKDFAGQQAAATMSAIDTLGGGGIVDLSNSCGVWC